MYEYIEIIYLWLIALIVSFLLYMAVAYIYYKRRLKNVIEMTQSVTDTLVSRMENVESAIIELKVGFASVKTTIKIWGAIIGFIFMLLSTYVVGITLEDYKQKQQTETRK